MGSHTLASSQSHACYSYRGQRRASSSTSVVSKVGGDKRGLGFHIDDAVGGPVVTVRSADTGEVVRQIPNEVVVRVAHSIEKMKGLMFNSKT